MEDFPRIKRMGERAILLEFKPEITPETLQKVLTAKAFLEEKLLKDKVEVTNAYNSLLITYPLAIEDAYGMVLSLKEDILKAKIDINSETRLFYIPVCYDGIVALDLAEISAAANLSKKQIIELHSAEVYTVYFTGFLPGFLYLGGLPQALHFSRRTHPRLQVEKGAVGIGEKQTGIYPQSSPGGWNIIGNSPVPLFDPNVDPPCQIRSGDKVKFYPIGLEEHRRISEEVERGEFSFKMEANG